MRQSAQHDIFAIHASDTVHSRMHWFMHVSAMRILGKYFNTSQTKTFSKPWRLQAATYPDHGHALAPVRGGTNFRFMSGFWLRTADEHFSIPAVAALCRLQTSSCLPCMHPELRVPSTRFSTKGCLGLPNAAVPRLSGPGSSALWVPSQTPAPT
jgi:hypothetical protein